MTFGGERDHGRHGNPLRGARKGDWKESLRAVYQLCRAQNPFDESSCGRIAVVSREAPFRDRFPCPPRGGFRVFRGENNQSRSPIRGAWHGVYRTHKKYLLVRNEVKAK